jgi:endonuclease YncB( thermonuclease family)
MKATTALFLCLLGASHVGAADVAYPVYEPFKAKILRAADGNTFTARALDCGPAALCDFTIRIFALDTPESRRGGGLAGAKCEKERRLGIIAKTFAKQKMLDEIVTVVPLQRAQQTDPRGRFLASVTLKDGTDYAKMMIRTGNGRFYDPAAAGDFKKPDYCH